MRRHLGVISLLLVPGWALADTPPPGDGFTFELGAGPALTISYDRDPGFAPLSVAAGGFVSDRVAIVGRVAHTALRHTNFGPSQSPSWLVHGFYGAAVEYFAPSGLFLSVGFGIGLYGQAPIGGDMYLPQSRIPVDLPTSRGIGQSARIGYVVLAAGRHSLRVGIEQTMTWFQYHQYVTSSAAVLEWQLH